MTSTLIPPARLRPRQAAECGTAALDAAILPGRAEILVLGLRRPAMTASIFMPLRSAGGGEEDRSRLTGLIAISRQLIRDGCDERRAESLLAPVRARIAEPAFWSNPPVSLALFATASALIEFRLPVRLPEQVVVCHHPHIKPLMPLVQDDSCFSLLTLTREGVRLLAGSRRGLMPIAQTSSQTLDEVVCAEPPTGSAGALRRIRAPAREAHIGPGSITGEASDQAMDAVIRRIDGHVTSRLSSERTPLVIAGIEQLLKRYWRISRYPHLLRSGIAMDSLPASTTALHAIAWDLIAAHISARADDARKRYDDLAGTRRTSRDIATVLCALVHDRVAHLFIASDVDRWGTFDAVTLQVREHRQPWPGDDDLLNLLIICASTTHTHVQVVPHRNMPGGGLVAAVFHP